MKDLDLDLVPADAELVERDLDGLVDAEALRFDAGSHEAPLYLACRFDSICCAIDRMLFDSQ